VPQWHHSPEKNGIGFPVAGQLASDKAVYSVALRRTAESYTLGAISGQTLLATGTPGGPATRQSPLGLTMAAPAPSQFFSIGGTEHRPHTRERSFRAKPRCGEE
jgi:hypothetical protein